MSSFKVVRHKTGWRVLAFEDSCDDDSCDTSSTETTFEDGLIILYSVRSKYNDVEEVIEEVSASTSKLALISCLTGAAVRME